jgi:hypothetical protein
LPYSKSHVFLPKWAPLSFAFRFAFFFSRNNTPIDTSDYNTPIKRSFFNGAIVFTFCFLPKYNTLLLPLDFIPIGNADNLLPLYSSYFFPNVYRPLIGANL